jgi:hypothetical protein
MKPQLPRQETRSGKFDDHSRGTPCTEANLYSRCGRKRRNEEPGAYLIPRTSYT